MKRWRIIAISFDHMHMADLLRMAVSHPEAEIVGISDEQPERALPVLDSLSISRDQFFADYRKCLELKPDLAILCPATGRHGDWVERVAPSGAHVLVEKPFAATLAEADRMIAALQATGKQLAINWPLRWYRPFVTARRLVDEGFIGAVREVHHYGGNRGPLRRLMDREGMPPEQARAEVSKSWFYQAGAGGGSLLDYVGYGVTMGTWFMNGRKPIEVMCMTDTAAGFDVDDHAVVVARYETGLSKFESRWGTFTDPWTHLPIPNCGFSFVGEKGTIGITEYNAAVRVQTKEKPEGFLVPNDELIAPERDPIEYMLHRIATVQPVDGPLSPRICRIGQQIIETAIHSAKAKRALPLIGG